MASSSHGNTWQMVPNNARRRKQPKPKYWSHFMRLFTPDPSLKRVRELIYYYAWLHEPRDTDKKDFVVSENGVERNVPRVHFVWNHLDGTMHKEPHRDSICNLHLVSKRLSAEFLSYVYSRSSLEIDIDLKTHETAESTAALQSIVASLDRTPNFKRHTRDVRVRIHFPDDYPKHRLPSINQGIIEKVADRLDRFLLSSLSVDVVMMRGYDDYELRLSTFPFYPIIFRGWSIQVLDTTTYSWEKLSRETQRRLDTAWDVYMRDGPVNGWKITGQLKPEIFAAHGATSKRALVDGKSHHQKAEAHEPESPKAADAEFHHCKIRLHEPEPEPKKAKPGDRPHKKDVEGTRYQQASRAPTPDQKQAKSDDSRPEAAAPGRLSSVPSRQASPVSSVAETPALALVTPALPRPTLLEPHTQTPSVLSVTASEQDSRSDRLSSSGTRANSPASAVSSTPKPALPLGRGTQRVTLDAPAPRDQTPPNTAPTTLNESVIKVSTGTPILKHQAPSHQAPSHPTVQRRLPKPTAPAMEGDQKDIPGSMEASAGETQAAKKGKKKKRKPKSRKQNKTGEGISTGSSGGVGPENSNSDQTRPESKPGSLDMETGSCAAFVPDSNVPKGLLGEATTGPQAEVEIFHPPGEAGEHTVIFYPPEEAGENAAGQPVDPTKYSEVVCEILSSQDATEGEVNQESPERPSPKSERRTRHPRSYSLRRREALVTVNRSSLVAPKQGGTKPRSFVVDIENPYSSVRSFEDTAREAGLGTEQEATEAIDPCLHNKEPQE